MGLAVRHSSPQRDLHLFDSFEGLPEPTEKDGEFAKEYSGGRATGALKSVGQCQADVQQVKTFLLEELGLEASKVHFHVGWFQNTLPTAAPTLGPIALLRVDGDWHESTRVCLEHLYPLVSSGGVVILDDYFGWAGCKQATDEYRARHGITAELTRVDQAVAYWMKP